MHRIYTAQKNFLGTGKKRQKFSGIRAMRKNSGVNRMHELESQRRLRIDSGIKNGGFPRIFFRFVSVRESNRSESHFSRFVVQRGKYPGK